MDANDDPVAVGLFAMCMLVDYTRAPARCASRLLRKKGTVQFEVTHPVCPVTEVARIPAADVLE